MRYSLIFLCFMLIGCDDFYIGKAKQEAIEEQRQELKEITSQSEADMPVTVTVDDTLLILYPPKGAYWVDFSKEKTQPLKQAIEEGLGFSLGLGKWVLVSAFVFPAHEPYTNESCSGSGRSYRCRTWLFTPSNMEKVCYLVENEIVNKMLFSNETPQNLRLKLARDYIKAAVQETSRNDNEFYNIKVLAHSDDYFVSHAAEKHNTIYPFEKIRSVVMLKGRIFSAQCYGVRQGTRWQIPPDGWEAHTIIEWLKHLVEVNNSSQQSETN